METIINYSILSAVIKLLDKIQNKNLRSFVAFFFTAVLGAGTNLITRIWYKDLFSYLGFSEGVAFNLSVFMGYLTATVVSFVPQKIFAFDAKSSGNTKRETIKYLIIAFSALGIQIGVSNLALHYITNPLLSDFSVKVRETSAHIVGMGFSFFANFYGHKLLTFRSTGIYDKVKARTNRG
jgi:putative flippase GtrA